jgi:hypothetical protein
MLVLEACVSMSEGTGAPVGDTSAATAPEGTTAAVGSESQASAAVGNAPDGGVDAGAGSVAQGTDPSAQQAAAEYLFGGRKFRDQKHAEDYFRSQAGRTPELQRQMAAFQAEKAQMQAEIEALRASVVGRQGQGQVQASPQAVQGASGQPKSFADELAQGGDLKFMRELAENPEYGLEGALYVLAQKMDERVGSRVDQLKSETIDPYVHRNEQAQVVARTFGAAKNLAQNGFPELDDSNQSPEAAEAQQEILERLKEMSPEFVRKNPERALRQAVLDYRYEHGTPVFATPPGTSGSPSVRAAAALEASQRASAAIPMDGQGVPRPRPAGTVETPEDRIRRENREVTGELKTPSGRVLGFSA